MQPSPPTPAPWTNVASTSTGCTTAPNIVPAFLGYWGCQCFCADALAQYHQYAVRLAVVGQCHQILLVSCDRLAVHLHRQNARANAERIFDGNLVRRRSEAIRNRKTRQPLGHAGIYKKLRDWPLESNVAL